MTVEEKSTDQRDDNTPTILFVIGPLQIGGTERHLLAILPQLQLLGWRPAVYTLSGQGPLQGDFERARIELIFPPVKRGHRPYSLFGRVARLGITAAHLLGVLLKRRPAIVHFFLPAPYQTGAPLAFLARSRIRVMSRRSLNNYQSAHRYARAYERILHWTMTAILGNSRRVIRQLRTEGIPAARLGLIYNGIDMTPFNQEIDRAKIRTTLGLATATLVLVIVANLIPYKGHSDLLAALAIAVPQLPADWRLVIVGQDYGIEDRLRAQALALGISPNVMFFGPRGDVAEIFLASDIALLVSHQEGFSNAILEAMAAGLPVIATDVGGNQEAVINGKTGILVPPRDPQRLAQAIIILAEAGPLRSSLGMAARARVVEHFTIERCVARYDSLYCTLLAGGKPKDVVSVAVET